MRIALVISSLSAGGAERVMSTMANHWVTQGHEIILITLSDTAADFYPLHPSIERVGLGLLCPSANFWQALSHNAERIYALRRIFRMNSPSVVVSFMDSVNVLCIIAAWGLGVPVIISERTDVQSRPVGRIWSLLRRWTYPRASAIVAQSERARSWAEQVAPRVHIVVIPNPVLPCVERDDELAAHLPQGQLIVGMGRLEAIKGFDLLLEAFAAAHHGSEEWRLVILGEGPERSRLESLADALGIAPWVSLPGLVQYPERVLCRASLFVLSSRVDGFPNSLLEAMACGLPVIAFDCPGGVREIIRPGIDGLLVPPQDVAALARAISELMGDAEKRRLLGIRAREVCQRFGIEPIMARWNRLIMEVVGE